MQPSSRDIVLMALLSANGEIRGRTTLQKLTYFEGIKTKINTGHKPHFYGPYSRTIADSLALLVSIGVVEEDFNSIGDQRAAYTYRLTEVGRKIAKSLAKRFGDIYPVFVETTNKSNAESNLNPRVMAVASKIHYTAIKSNKSKMTFSEIKEEATKLGWKLQSDEIGAGAKLLVSLGLATQN